MNTIEAQFIEEFSPKQQATNERLKTEKYEKESETIKTIKNCNKFISHQSNNIKVDVNVNKKELSSKREENENSSSSKHRENMSSLALLRENIESEAKEALLNLGIEMEEEYETRGFLESNVYHHHHNRRLLRHNHNIANEKRFSKIDTGLKMAMTTKTNNNNMKFYESPDTPETTFMNLTKHIKMNPQHYRLSNTDQSNYYAGEVEKGKLGEEQHEHQQQQQEDSEEDDEDDEEDNELFDRRRGFRNCERRLLNKYLKKQKSSRQPKTTLKKKCLINKSIEITGDDEDYYNGLSQNQKANSIKKTILVNKKEETFYIQREKNSNLLYGKSHFTKMLMMKDSCGVMNNDSSGSGNGKSFSKDKANHSHSHDHNPKKSLPGLVGMHSTKIKDWNTQLNHLSAIQGILETSRDRAILQPYSTTTITEKIQRTQRNSLGNIRMNMVNNNVGGGVEHSLQPQQHQHHLRNYQRHKHYETISPRNRNHHQVDNRKSYYLENLRRNDESKLFPSFEKLMRTKKIDNGSDTRRGNIIKNKSCHYD